MKSFKDNSGRRWDVAIHVAAVRAVRDALGVNLYTALADNFEGYQAIVGDPIMLVDVLFVLCRTQAEKAGVTDEDFGRAMAGDVIVKAVDVFTEELIDFFPDARLRKIHRAVMSKAKEVGSALILKAEQAVKRLDAQKILSTMSNVSTNSPASSASTPAPSPGGN